MSSLQMGKWTISCLGVIIWDCLHVVEFLLIIDETCDMIYKFQESDYLYGESEGMCDQGGADNIQ